MANYKPQCSVSIIRFSEARLFQQTLDKPVEPTAAIACPFCADLPDKLTLTDDDD